jgi:hypothetical protein
VVVFPDEVERAIDLHAPDGTKLCQPATPDQECAMTAELVNVDTFTRAETDRMFAALAQQAGGVNQLHHNRVPTPLDQQPVIRMNRDTLYSLAIVDLQDGATLTVPQSGDRYVSVMVVNNDHYINRIIHDAGEHRLTVDEFDTRYVAVAARVLVDPNDPADIAAVSALQDGFGVDADSAQPFAPPEHDAESLDDTRTALLHLAKNVQGFARTFGARADVDPVRHLLGTAAGWGGLPESEAFYVNVDPGFPVGRYTLRVGDVPVDGFWSISLYDADGYFPNTGEPVSVNDITAVHDADGGITVHFGDWSDATPNRLPVADGWNYLVRLYRPRAAILDGSWTFPAVAPA